MAFRDQAEFVQAVMDELQLSQTELGVELRKGNAYQQVHGWLTGRLKLGYQDTMRMLELTGWIRIESGVRPGVAEDVAANQKEILENQLLGLEILREIREAIGTARATGRTQPRRTR